MSTLNKTPKKKRTIRKKIILAIIFLEVAGFLTGIGFFIAATIAGVHGFNLSSIGGSIFFAVTGSTMAFVIIGAIIPAIIKQRKFMQTNFSSTTNPIIIPYTTENYPVDSKPYKKKVYYCAYCGYGTDKRVGECPKCGGPIKSD